jgi:hypothetical protein
MTGESGTYSWPLTYRHASNEGYRMLKNIDWWPYKGITFEDLIE